MFWFKSKEQIEKDCRDKRRIELEQKRKIIEEKIKNGYVPKTCPSLENINVSDWDTSMVMRAEDFLSKEDLIINIKGKKTWDINKSTLKITRSQAI